LSTKRSFIAFLMVVRQLGKILLVGAGRWSRRCRRGELREFFLEAADCKHLAAEGDFAGHGDVAADGNFGERAGEAVPW